MASSALPAWMTSKPAFSIYSAESIRNRNSSSTIKITGPIRGIQFNPPFLQSGLWSFCSLRDHSRSQRAELSSAHPLLAPEFRESDDYAFATSIVCRIT
jgi:hypothetical protein